MKTFLNTTKEWHAFVIGMGEVLCPWPPRVRIPSPLTGERHQAPVPSPSTGEGKGESDKGNFDFLSLLFDLAREYHYYLFGRGIGVIAWIIIAKIIQEVFW